MTPSNWIIRIYPGGLELLESTQTPVSKLVHLMEEAINFHRVPPLAPENSSIGAVAHTYFTDEAMGTSQFPHLDLLSGWPSDSPDGLTTEGLWSAWSLDTDVIIELELSTDGQLVHLDFTAGAIDR